MASSSNVNLQINGKLITRGVSVHACVAAYNDGAAGTLKGGRGKGDFHPYRDVLNLLNHL